MKSLFNVQNYPRYPTVPMGRSSFEIVWGRNPLVNRSRLKDEHANRSSQHGERRPVLRERSLGREDRGQRLRLVAFRGENRFRIGAGNFAHSNPADATNQRSDQKRNGREWNET